MSHHERPLTEEEIDDRLAAELGYHDCATCPNCGRVLDRGDIAWSNGQTEFGTENSTVEIQCQRCDEEIALIWSWWPGIEGMEDLLYVLEHDWHIEKRKRPRGGT